MEMKGEDHRDDAEVREWRCLAIKLMISSRAENRDFMEIFRDILSGCPCDWIIVKSIISKWFDRAGGEVQKKL